MIESACTCNPRLQFCLLHWRTIEKRRQTAGSAFSNRWGRRSIYWRRLYQFRMLLAPPIACLTAVLLCRSLIILMFTWNWSRFARYACWYKEATTNVPCIGTLHMSFLSSISISSHQNVSSDILRPRNIFWIVCSIGTNKCKQVYWN